jgi:glycosyltransferase involved in cell wall biosynthesis
MAGIKGAALGLGHGLWRQLPQDIRRRCMSGLAAALARKPDRPGPGCSNGIIVAGDTEGANGLAESARIMHAVIAAHGMARGLVPLGLPSVVPAAQVEVPKDAALLAVLNAPILPVGLLRHKRDFIAGRRVIGMWAWELPVLPGDWRYGAKFVHEIWAPSQFTADAVEILAPGRVRVVPYPLAALPEMQMTGDRASFDLPADALVVLTIFNLASSMARKNPLGNIAAFKAAFGARRDCLFVLKISGDAEVYREDWKIIKAAIADAPNIRLISETLPEPQLRGLIAASDIVMSLHRSEGFGLVPATAMLLGRPVVATGWSGNLTFMTPETSALVDYRLVPVVDPRGNYEVRHARWAEPDVEAAASWLRRLGDDAMLRQRMGEAGRAYAQSAIGAGPVLAALAANGVAAEAAQKNYTAEAAQKNDLAEAAQKNYPADAAQKNDPADAV